MTEAVNHAERAHSKFSASGSERWHNCPASVPLEESSPPSKDTHWSKEGTLGHEVLELRLLGKPLPMNFDITENMLSHIDKTIRKIKAIHKVSGGTLLVEKRVYAMFIHEEMFGTCDVIIAGADRILHIIDFKFGAGHVVDAKENFQLIQYALSAAESYDWDFDFVEMHILQPRAQGDWAKRWKITIKELKEIWLPKWHEAVEAVEMAETFGAVPNPGSWCHWCRAKAICPAKKEVRAEKVSNLFLDNPLTSEVKNGFEKKSSKKSNKEKGRQKSAGKKSKAG